MQKFKSSVYTMKYNALFWRMCLVWVSGTPLTSSGHLRGRGKAAACMSGASFYTVSIYNVDESLRGLLGYHSMLVGLIILPCRKARREVSHHSYVDSTWELIAASSHRCRNVPTPWPWCFSPSSCAMLLFIQYNKQWVVKIIMKRSSTSRRCSMCQL